ncbi:MAG: hypothetical protein COA58_13825 [Bacteroidetes bacterium]|nr:MAG: hypothetical protein COA58_13825 [Bacteroidota bacterium]
MKFWKLYIILCLLAGCSTKLDKSEILKVGTIDCKSVPAFVKKTPINPKKVAFSTSQNRQKGVTLLEYGSSKSWKHPSYNQFGYFGQIETANDGRIFLAPTPIINATSEPESGYNSIYSIDPNSGELSLFIRLSEKKAYDPNNPYGILGISFDCSSNILYATSVYYSNKENEAGILYAIDVQTREVLDTYKGIDAFGCYALGYTGEKRLYFGSTRTSNVRSIELSRKGKFIGKPRNEFSLDLLGPRGDDKAKKIVFKNNKLIVTGYEFMNTLIAPTDVQETRYSFQYQASNKTWDYIQSQP